MAGGRLPDFDLERTKNYLQIAIVTRALTLAGILAAIQVPELRPSNNTLFLTLAGFEAVANAGYFALGFKRWPHAAFHFTGLVDIFAIGALVAMTGGTSSIYVMIFALVIVFNGVFYGWPGTISAGVPSVVALFLAGTVSPEPLNFPLLAAKLAVIGGLGIFAGWVGHREKQVRGEMQEATRQISRHAKQLNALHETSATIRTQLELEGLQTKAVESLQQVASEIWGPDVAVGIALFEGDEVVIERAVGAGLNETVGSRFPAALLPRDMRQRLAAGQIDFMTPEAMSELRNYFEIPHGATGWGAPIRDGDDLVGVLGVQSGSGTMPDSQQMQLLETLANHISSAVAQIRVFETERLGRERAIALFELARDLSAFDNIGEVLRRIAASGRAVAKVNSCALGLLREDGAINAALWTIDSDYETSEINGSQPLAIGELASVLERGQPVEIRRSAERLEPAQTLTSLLGAESCLVFPVAYHGSLRGLLCFGNQAGGFTISHYQLGEAIAGLAAVAVENAHHHEADREVVATLTERDRRKDEMVSMASHELRSPLTSITGYARTLLTSGMHFTDDERREFLKVIDQQAKQLARLIDELLTVSHFEEGRKPLVLERMDLSRLAYDCIAAAKMRSEVHEFSVDVDASLPPVVGDESKLEEVLTNLIDNAIKYSPEGGRVTVGARMSGVEVLLWVCDEGVGIPEDDLAKVFQKFYRVSGRPADGAGLGLWIVEELVKAHDGRVWAERNEDRGTTFFLALPQRRATDLSSHPSALTD